MGFFNGQCLIAMPGMQDDRFDHSVVYVCAHTQEGAMGLTINRPIKDLSFSSLLSQLHIDQPQQFDPPPILAGGPVDVSAGLCCIPPNTAATRHWP